MGMIHKHNTLYQSKFSISGSKRTWVFDNPSHTLEFPATNHWIKVIDSFQIFMKQEVQKWWIEGKGEPCLHFFFPPNHSFSNCGSLSKSGPQLSQVSFSILLPPSNFCLLLRLVQSVCSPKSIIDPKMNRACHDATSLSSVKRSSETSWRHQGSAIAVVTFAT